MEPTGAEFADLGSVTGTGVSETDALGVTDVVDVGYGGGLGSDVALFGDSMSAAAARLEAGGSAMPVTEMMMEPLGAIDREATALGDLAREMQASGLEMTPSELVTLTVHSQEFMFHSTLTANVANRTADGLQQLFKQQG